MVWISHELDLVSTFTDELYPLLRVTASHFAIPHESFFTGLTLRHKGSLIISLTVRWTHSFPCAVVAIPQ